jgi:membrane-associated phospholipid phosphatase
MNVLVHAIGSLDLRVYHFLNGYAGHWLLDRLAAFEEDNNLFKGGLFLAVYAYLWFRICPEREKRRRAIIAIFTGTMAALLVSRTIADIAPFRMRPMYDPGIFRHAHSFSIMGNMENWSSFPSDTAAYFFALAFGLAYLLRRYSALMLYTVVWVCLPRLFLGEHYLSDIVAGGAIGIAMVWLSVRSEWLRSSLATRVLSRMDANPGIFYASAFLVCFEMGVLFNDVRCTARYLFHASRAALSQGTLHSLPAAGALLGLVMIAGFAVVRASNWFHLRVQPDRPPN